MSLPSVLMILPVSPHVLSVLLWTVQHLLDTPLYQALLSIVWSPTVIMSYDCSFLLKNVTEMFHLTEQTAPWAPVPPGPLHDVMVWLAASVFAPSVDAFVPFGYCLELTNLLYTCTRMNKQEAADVSCWLLFKKVTPLKCLLWLLFLQLDL